MELNFDKIEQIDKLLQFKYGWTKFLNKHADIVNEQVDTLDALMKFHFDKNQNLLLQLIDIMKKLDKKMCKWDKHKRVGEVLDKVLKKYKDSLNYTICEEIFAYLIILTDKCDHEETINRAWDALRLFPFVKFQSSLLQLIDVVQYQFNSECNWKTHGRFGVLVQEIIRKHKNVMIFIACARIFEYLMKIIENCDDEETIYQAFDTLAQLKSVKFSFQFDKCEPTLLKLLEFSENQLSKRKFTNDKQLQMCEVISWMLAECRPWNPSSGWNSFSDQILHRMFEYHVKIIERCDGEDERTIDRASDALAQFPNNQIQFLLFEVCQSLINDLNLPQSNWRLHHNWCLAISKIITQTKLSDQNTQILLSLILMIENLYIEKFFQNQLSLLNNKLEQHFYNDDCPFVNGFTDNFNCAQYEVYWCVRWCADNVLVLDKPIELLPLVKLSPDRFGVRNDRNFGDDFVPVRSLFAVTSGVYFYEALIVTNGKIRIGWSMQQASFKKLEADDEGEERLSVFLDVTQKSILHYEQTKFHPGDVIGCLVDFDKQRIVFYYNGQPMEYSLEIDFTFSALYATALLSPHQQCHFNFGQSPFKFAPIDITFRHFHMVSGGDGSKYRLAETERFCNYFGDSNYWFKHSAVDNQVILLFNDQTQIKCDEVVKCVELNIQNDQDIEEWRLDIVKIENCFKCVRYIQSIFEMMGKVIGDDKLDVLALWIGLIIEKWIDNREAEEAKLLELLYPYLQLQINSTEACAKHRMICIVLSHLIRLSERYDNEYNFIKPIHREVFTYLTRTLTETNDEWTQMFVLIALGHGKLSADEKKMLNDNQKFLEKLNYWKQFFVNANIVDYITAKNIFTPENRLVLYQHYFLSEHFFSQVLNPPPVPQPNPAALNSNDRTEHLKLSSNQLSARSDWAWQSVRSVCQVHKGNCYFEAVLLTNGPMRIGWSTKKTEIVRTEVGGDAFSIGFDGYNRCVWHNDEKLQVESSFPRWKARDVIGCLIEVIKNTETNEKEKKFSFYLNGQQINYQTSLPIYSSPHPYHAAVSLSSHQQVYLNFGQFKFKFLPEKDYLSFYDYPQVIHNRKSSINMSNSNITNALITVESTNTIKGNVSMSYQNYTSYPSIDNILRKELCITCPVCHKEILSKRFLFDCCACLKLSMKTPTGNQLLAIGSTHNYEAESISTESTIKCPLCHKVITTKLLRFTCCDHLQFCFECARKLGDCLKCQQKPSTSKDCQQVNKQQFECQFCAKRITTRPLQFFACDHGKLCHDCAKIILDCPKCAK